MIMCSSIQTFQTKLRLSPPTTVKKYKYNHGRYLAGEKNANYISILVY